MAAPDTFGNDTLCAWLVTPGKCWIQTRDPQLARKLADRNDTELVAWGVGGGYLRTYRIERPFITVKQIINRYLTRTGDAVSAPKTPVEWSESPAKETTAGARR